MILKKVGEGAHGSVFMGCANKACVYKYAVKKSEIENLSTEYKLSALAYDLSPGGVVRPLAFKDGVIYSNYVPTSGSINKKNFKKIFKKVLLTLIDFQKKYPSFRHNDLSWRNVFIDNKGNALIGDFGLSYVDKNGYRNPMITSNEFKFSHGTYPNNDPKFDAHFFLNSIYMDIPEMRSTVAKYLPKEYRGIDTPKVKNGRLKFGVTHTKMPSIKQLFSKLTLNE